MASNLIKIGAVYALFCFYTSAQAVYGSGTGTVADPAYQPIGIYNMNFTAVPEINPALSALVACLLAAGITIRQRRKIATSIAKDR